MSEGIASEGIAVDGIASLGIARLGIAGIRTGAILPAARSEIQQWVIDSDFTDKVSPQLVDSPKVTGVSVLRTGGVDGVVSTGIDLDFDTTITQKLIWNDAITGRNSGTVAQTNNRMLLQRDGSAIRVVTGSVSDSVSVPYITGDIVEIKQAPSGDVFVDGSFAGNTGGNVEIDDPVDIRFGCLNSAGTNINFTDVTLLKTEVQKDIDLIILFGDSQAEGRPEGFGSLSATLQLPQISSLTQATSYTSGVDDPLEPFSSTRWGGEIVGADTIQQAKRRVAVVKVAYGGSRCSIDWQKGDTRYNTLVSTFASAISALEAKGLNVHVRQVWSVLGTNDALEASSADFFEQNFLQMKSDMQADLEIDVPWVLIRNHNSLTAPYNFNSTVRTQQDSLNGTDDITVIDSDAYGLALGDGVHFDSNGNQAMGSDFATEYLSLNLEYANNPMQVTYYGAGSGSPWNMVSNSLHLTTTGAVTWTTNDDVNFSHFLQNGGYMAVQGTNPRIGALLDGSGLAANGLPLTNLGGYVHNGFEGSILQTDLDEAIFNGVTLYGDGVTWTAVDYADLRAHLNGLYNFWIKCIDINGVPHYVDLSQYLADRGFTPSEYLQNTRYFSDNCGTGSMVPAEVTAGTGIGPNGEWADNGDGKILLVEDA